MHAYAFSDSTINLVGQGQVTTIAGFLSGRIRRWYGCRGQVCLHHLRDGSRIVVCDYANNRIRLVHTATRKVSTIAGADLHGPVRNGVPVDPPFKMPRCLVWDASTTEPDSHVLFSVWNGLCRLNINTGQFESQLSL